MARRKTKPTTGGKSLATTAPPREIAHRMAGGDAVVRVEALFHVPRIHPKGTGPWENEADKIAWTDVPTGYGCIIRRSPKGHLCGYVGIAPGHSLHGLHPAAMHDILISVHGGLDYAAPCEEWEPEEVSVCHVGENPRKHRLVPPGFRQRVHANEAADSGDDLWWLGFSCNQLCDFAPGMFEGQDAERRLLAGVVDRTYRGEAYVHAQCVRLAAQLKAVEDGRNPRDADPGPDTPFHNPRRTEG